MKKNRIFVILGVLAMSLMLLTVVMAAPEDTGGPDAFGYVYIDSNEAGGPAYNFIDITATGITVTLGDDATSDPISTTFPFHFYGTEFDEFYFNSNGYLSFDDSGSDFSNSCPLDGDSPSNIVAIMWDDLDPGDTGALAYYQSFTAGNCPYDGYPGACMVAQYQDFVHWPGPDGGNAGTWEAILFDDDSIVLQYADVGVEEGSGSTTGIGNSDGSINLNYGSCNTAGHIAADLAILFAALDPADISVDPSALASTQEPDTLATVPMTISNGGEIPLNWEIQEQVPANAPPENPSGVTEKVFVPDAAPAGRPTSNLLGENVQDGGFEAGSPNPYWTESSTNFGSPLCTLASCGTGGGTGPHAGDWWVWFGGIAAYEEGAVSQDVVIPTGATDLTFYLETPVCDSASDYMELNVDGTQEFVVDGGGPLCGVIGYSLQTVDISAYADGSVHNVEFHSEIFATNQTVGNFFVDDVSIYSVEPGDCTQDAIAWASADPNSGTAAPDGSSMVDVTFDSTGLAIGVYTGTLCVQSNDPDTPELLVDLTLNVELLPTGVSLSSFTGDSPAAMTPIWLLAVTAAAIVGGLVLRRRFSKQTR